MKEYVVRLAECGLADSAVVGARNAALGEMIGSLSQFGIKVPDGFSTTAQAFRDFLDRDGLGETIHSLLHGLDVGDFDLLARRAAEVRRAIIDAPLPGELLDAISSAWNELVGRGDIALALRSSMSYDTDDDSPFVGQQERLLNLTDLSQLIAGIHEIFASMYSERAIAHRAHRGVDHSQVSMSVAVQRMVQNDGGSAGVMFTLDTESGFRDLVLITSTYGLGEAIVEGAVSPDEFYVYKPLLRAGHDAIVRRSLGFKSSKLVCGTARGARVRAIDIDVEDQRKFSLGQHDVLALARQALVIEDHFGRPMGIEWVKDNSGELYVLQAMPETVQSRHPQGTVQLTLKERGRVLTSGRSIGRRVSSGRARVVTDLRGVHRIQAGEVLITDMTNPDWEPVMKRVAAVVTDRGGRTSHAAIAARELGIAAVVGCGDATSAIRDGMDVTVSCAEGEEGFVYEGLLDYDLQAFRVAMLPKIPVRLMMNISNPDRAFSLAATPNYGVGLAKVEAIINRMIGIHPLAALEYREQTADVRRSIDDQIGGYPDAATFFVEKLAEGIACIAASVAPNPVVVRLSDLKSNEYASLIGGAAYELTEENPLLGFRGVSRYLDARFEPAFELECRALKRVREDVGLDNVQILVPFVRTVGEAWRIVDMLGRYGLKRGENDLKVLMTCETPNNALAAKQFLEHFDGMSIALGDLTQLVLGVDRDSDKVAKLFDERTHSVRTLLSSAIETCRLNGKHIGISGELSAADTEFADWLVEQGVDTISLSPDAVIPTWLHLAQHLGGPQVR